MIVAAPDTQLHVREAGTGRPLVLVHGGTGTGSFDWGPLIPRLAEHFRVVWFDLRGHGHSPAPGLRLGIVRFGLDTHRVMQALGIPRALLVGFSAGANSLLTLTIRHPRVAAGLVTIGGSMTSDPARVKEILSGPWPEDLRAIDHVAGGGPDHWRALRRALAEDWAANNVFSREMLARITCPFLAIHGERDRIVFPEQAELLSRHVPNGSMWLAPDAGHLVQKAAPAETAKRIVEFAGRISW
ncbi:MAG TPA: alpha/beta hydrolase [Acidimicrobiia bacterium]|nr:alpha/beta hydrolase [Acidimicrobiia bacterium]